MKIFALLLLWRLALIAIVRTSFDPDEHWQGPEVAHRLVFGYGYLTWEWATCLRTHLYPLLFTPAYIALRLAGLDYPALIRLAPRFTQVLLSVLHDRTVHAFSARWFPTINPTAIQLLSAMSWFNCFTHTRTLANTLESTLILATLTLWPPPPSSSTRHRLPLQDSAVRAAVPSSCAPVATNAPGAVPGSCAPVATNPPGAEQPCAAAPARPPDATAPARSQLSADDAGRGERGIASAWPVGRRLRRAVALCCAGLACVLRPTSFPVFLPLALAELHSLTQSAPPAVPQVPAQLRDRRAGAGAQRSDVPQASDPGACIRSAQHKAGPLPDPVVHPPAAPEQPSCGPNPSDLPTPSINQAHVHTRHPVLWNPPKNNPYCSTCSHVFAPVATFVFDALTLACAFVVAHAALDTWLYRRHQWLLGAQERSAGQASFHHWMFTVPAVTFSVPTFSFTVPRLQFTFPPYNNLQFNVVQNASALYGIHPWHWYVTQGLPAMMATVVPLVAWGLAAATLPRLPQSAATRRVCPGALQAHTPTWLTGTRCSLVPALLAAWIVAVFSLLAHKEFRFVLAAHELLLPYAALPLAWALQQLHTPKADQPPPLEVPTSATSSAVAGAVRLRPPRAEAGAGDDARSGRNNRSSCSALAEGAPTRAGIHIERRGAVGRRVLARVVLVFVALQLPMLLFFGRHHQRGTMAVMDWLAADLGNTNETAHVLFLTNCHATPWHAYLHLPAVRLAFLDCSPPGTHAATMAINEPGSTGVFHVAIGGEGPSEQQSFEADPMAYLCKVFGCALDSEGQQTCRANQGSGGEGELPSHVVAYDGLAGAIKGFLQHHHFTLAACFSQNVFEGLSICIFQRA